MDIFARDSLLEEGQVLSAERLNNDQVALFAGILRKYTQQIESLRSETESKVNELEAISIRTDFNNTEKAILLQLSEATHIATTYLNDLREENILRSPISGRGQIPTFRKHFVPEREQLLISVISESFQEQKYQIYCRAPLNTEPYFLNGTQINIQLAEYPYLDFGVVKGTVNGKRKFYDGDDHFFIEIELVNGLQTSRGHVIKPKSGFNGKAEVLLFRKSLLDHMWKNFRYQTEKVVDF